jgi:hypothetical protein|tara:strand:+ start:873 stop:1097 length:225 start_codon:yes stop_codon:yes gene_type:complete
MTKTFTLNIEDLKRNKETFVMWFQDGSERTEIWGRTELRKLARQYDFNVDEVLRDGETKMLDDDNDVIGGVFKE